MGQTHVNRWTVDLLRRIEEGQIDPSFVVTHTIGLDDGPEMYKTFRDKEDGCIKVVLKPGMTAGVQSQTTEQRKEIAA
jgi:threonine dehydrogenase-like Zn-dependent dehydrogenase